MKRPTVGDRVKINNPDSVYHGKIGTIIEDDGTEIPYNIRFDNFDTAWNSEKRVIPLEDSAPARTLKVGDVVRIKSREWYEKNKDVRGNVHFGDILFNEHMADFCGKSYKIKSIASSDPIRYWLDGNDGVNHWCFTYDMFDTTSILEETANRIEKILDGFFKFKDKPVITEDLPLIRPHKLLTHIKLD